AAMTVIVLALLAWALCFLFTAAAALLLARRWRTGRASLDAAAGLFLWIWLTTLLTFAVGLAGGLTAGWLAAVSGAGLAALLLVRPSRLALRESLRGGPTLARSLQALWSSWPRWLRWVTVVFVVVGGLRFALLIWALPPFIWDALTYHLTNVAQWIQDGRIGLFETPVQRIYSPANYEVLAAWFAVFLHHDVVIEAAGLPAYLLAGLSLYAIGRAFRLSSLGSWVATLAYLSTPALVFAATGTKNDPFVAAVFLFLAALILHLRLGLEQDGDVAVTPFLVLGLLAMAYAVGTKAYILQLAAGFIVLIVAPGLGAGPRRLARSAWAKGRAEIRSTSASARLLLLAVVGCGLVLGAYWNVRNWVLKGNPFYPYDVSVEAEAAPLTGSGHYGFGWARLEGNLQVLADKFGDKKARVVPDLPDTTGWGWIVYGMGLVAAAWAIVTDRRFRFLALGFAVSMVFLMASNTTSRWNMRYFIWLPALFALAVGLFLDPVERMTAGMRRASLALFTFALAMNVVMTVNYNVVPWPDLMQMLALPVFERDAGRFLLRAPVEYSHVYTYVPRDAVLGYNVHENGFVYPLYRADFSQRLVYVPFSPEDSCEAIAEAVEAHGTRYLFVAPEHTDDARLAKLRECAETSSPIRERAGGLYVVKRDGG
ncbi:MAG TPA: hypothetical protein VK449_03070, partial [Anaerolineales bacterium]|nr:hypothetical protein [Anaerolineales bacterium]